MLNSLFRKRPPLDVAQALQQAFGLHQQGRLDEAAPLYAAILEAQPGHFDARHLLGVLRLQQGRNDEALALISQALVARPNSPEAFANQGMALQALGRHAEALESYDRAIVLRPDFADAIFNRANALVALGRYADALASCDRAIALKPGFAAAMSARGDTLQRLHRYGEALATYDATLALQPERADTLNNRGSAARALGRVDEAIGNFSRALALQPDYAEALNNRGTAYADQHRYAEAIADYDQALSVNPDYADACINRGNALHAVGRDADAIADYDSALAIAPGHAEALYNRGIALRDVDRHEEAIADYDLALAHRPDFVEALHNRGIALTERDRHIEASADFEKALAIDPHVKRVLGDVMYSRARRCDWNDYDGMAQRVCDGVRAGKLVTVPLPLLNVADDPALELACARSFVADVYPPAAQPLWTGQRYTHDRIRVAYLSADFHDHPVAYLIAELFERHDRAQFEITAASFGPESATAMRARLVAGVDRFIDVRRMSDDDTARLLRDLEIDIAIDLTGFTRGARPGILACRPVPIQASYLGYPGTMGASYIDYIIADRFVIRPEDHPHYLEKVVSLPDCYQPSDTRRQIAEHVPSRVEAGLPQTGFVFCCFNNNVKIAPRIFTVWMRLLQQVEGAVLWLRESEPVAMGNLRREAATRGVDPARLVFAPRVSMEDHLARYRAADLFLDTLPYNAHATASDALWAGLPVLTCAGESFAARVAGSLLNAVGLPELITASLPEYEALALALAADSGRLHEIKERLGRARRTAPLFDIERFTRHIESAYRTMHDAQRRGESPASFDVSAIA